MIRATHDDCNGRLGLFYLVHGATLHGFNRPNRRPDIRDGFGYGLRVVRFAMRLHQIERGIVDVVVGRT